MDKKDERKNTSWVYNLTTHVLNALFPNDAKLVLDLSDLVKGLTQQQELVYQYGIKQWISSNYAAEKTPADKIASAEADFLSLCEHGIELLGEGKIGLKNRERANAKPKNQDGIVSSVLDKMTQAEAKSALYMVSIGAVKFSDEMLAKIKEKAESN